MKEFDLVIPKDLSAISLRQYQEYLNLYDKWDKEDDTYIKIKMLQIFCGLSPENVRHLDLSIFDAVINHLIEILSSDTPLIDRFYMDGKNSKGDDLRVTYGFIPSLDKMSFGEYIDLNTYINDWSNMHKAMSILFRPTIVNKKTVYDIEKYQGSYKYSNVMLDMPVSVALGAIVFFYRLMSKLPKLTLDYFQEVMKKEGEENTQLKAILEKDGVSISRFTHYAKEMSQEWTKLQVPIYINV